MIGRRGLAGLIDGPGPWRARLLALILRVTLVAGFLVYVPSVYVALIRGLPAIAVANTLAMVVVLALVLSPGMPFRWRASLYCLNFYVLADGPARLGQADEPDLPVRGHHTDDHPAGASGRVPVVHCSARSRSLASD